MGQKRFSLEGGEALIPALDAIVEYGSTIDIKEFVIGMAHRGRLSVLANIFKNLINLFLKSLRVRDMKMKSLMEM